MTQVLVIAVSVVVAVAIVCALILIVLAGGDEGPRRARLTQLDGSVDSYLDSGATWSATVMMDVQEGPQQIFELIADREYLNGLPFVSGPRTAADGLRVSRAVVFAYEEEVVEFVPGRSYAAVGTGVSVPLVIANSAQRFRVSPQGTGARVEWTVAFTPKWIGWLPLRWTAFVARLPMCVALSLILRRA